MLWSLEEEMAALCRGNMVKQPAAKTSKRMDKIEAMSSQDNSLSRIVPGCREC
jgi:hypothetical protein